LPCLQYILAHHYLYSPEKCLPDCLRASPAAAAAACAFSLGRGLPGFTKESGRTLGSLYLFPTSENSLLHYPSSFLSEQSQPEEHARERDYFLFAVSLSLFSKCFFHLFCSSFGQDL
jgi:hypothetical protein